MRRNELHILLTLRRKISMPVLFGKRYTKDELLERVGDISQICGAREVVLKGGMQDGVQAVEFRTGSGLTFTAVPGRGLDITIAEHNGRALAWRSPSGEVNPMFYEEPGLGWLRTFPGGLIATCGLTYLGAAGEDEGQPLGIHGRITNTPASNVWIDNDWDGDVYKMWVQGKVRESRLFGENIVLKRKISAILGENKIWIDDIVTNEGPRTTPHMLLYHINGGFPAVDENSIFLAPVIKTDPKDVEAERSKGEYHINQAPTNNFKECCYYHDMATDKDGFVYTALINNKINFGFYVKYKKEQLPFFNQWKQNGNKEYVVGMEPANCHIEGRAAERNRGTLQFLEPGEAREYHLEIGVLTSITDIQNFEGLIKSIIG